MWELDLGQQSWQRACCRYPTEWSGAAMSLRAELVRLGLRCFVKRKIGPATTLEALRRQDAFLARLVPPPPKGTQTTFIDLDGVKAVAVVTPASPSGRLVLYLHGGGHVSCSPALYGAPRKILLAKSLRI